MRKIGDNQDYMSREMDEELERLEELITALYTNAINEVTAKFTDYMARHKQFLEDMRQAYDEGYLTEAEYQAKIRNILFNSLMYQATIDSLTKTLVNTDEAAMAIIRGDLPYVIGQSYNYVQALGWAAADEAGYSTATFQIYNADAVQKLIKDNPDVLPYVDIPADKKWNKDRLNTVITQAIIQGQAIPQVAQSMQQVAQMDKNTAIRTARTTMTYAENLGRDTSYENLKAQGMPVHKEWSAVIDDRTRPTHKLLNGTRANKDGLFGEGILNVLLRCPADPNGEPQEIYNCRCRLGVVFDDEVVDHSKDDELYEQFLKENYPQDYEKLLEKDYFNKHTSKPVKTENKGEAKAQVADAKAISTAPIGTKFDNYGGLTKQAEYTDYHGTHAANRINDILRQGLPLSENYQRIVAVMDSYMQKTTAPIEAYRSVSLDTLGYMGLDVSNIQGGNYSEFMNEFVDRVGLLEGQEFIDKGFMSSSYMPPLSMGYRGIYLKMYVEAGTPAYLTSNDDEYEITFGRGLEVEISDVYIDTQKNVFGGEEQAIIIVVKVRKP